MLTTLDRESWAIIRHKLGRLGDNSSLIELVDSAIITICLDEHWEHNPNTVTSTKNSAYGLKPENRWYDKSLSLLVSQNGVIGFQMEHSWGDAMTSVSFTEKVLKDMATIDSLALENDFNTKENEAGRGSPSPVRKLEFEGDREIEKTVEEAKCSFKTKCQSLYFEDYFIPFVSKSSIAQVGVSPDALAQVALQSAYQRVRGNLGPVYEAASTAAFRHGRTETVRSLTEESK